MISETCAEIITSVLPHTMTDETRIMGLIREAARVVYEAVPGAIIECGVWRGGSMMAVAKVLMHLKAVDRALYLCDTFVGMTEPEEIDVDCYGRAAMDPAARSYDPAGCSVHASEVWGAMVSTGYPVERIYLVEGDVLETLPSQAPDQIALLHLDTDWYKSTRHELEALYPRVSPGGCIMIDDYGHWQGARKATDEYVAQYVPGVKLEPCGYTAVILRKP